MRTIFARKRRGFRRALPAAILTVALAAAGVPVVATLTAQPASAATVGQSGSTTGAPVYANGTGTSPNQDKVAWLSWGANRAPISTDPSVVRTVTNWHQISDTERVEVTCTLTPKQDKVIYSSTFDTSVESVDQVHPDERRSHSVW